MSFLDNMGGGGFLGFNNLETALQNLNKNLSQLIQSLGNVTWNGTNAKTSSVVTSATLIYAGSGTLVNFAVTVAGVAGTINNSATVAGAASGNVLCATPATVGIVAVGSRFTNGLVVSPGAGQSVNVTYIPG